MVTSTSDVQIVEMDNRVLFSMEKQNKKRKKNNKIDTGFFRFVQYHCLNGGSLFSSQQTRTPVSNKGNTKKKYFL